MITIYAEQRKKTGTKDSRKTRIQNKCPAIIYGKDNTNIPIIINQNILTHTKINIILTNNIKIIIHNTNYIVKIHQIQYHPFKQKIIHIDFLYLQ